jgi:putative membrane protein
MLTDTRFAQAVEDAVQRIEARTAAEVVVVAAPSSGDHADRAVLVGAIAGVAALAFLCWSPWPFDPMWFPADVALVGALAWRIASAAPGLLVRTVGEARRRSQVRIAARAAFVEESVHGTADRCGVLVYVSAAEQLVEVIPDAGLEGRIPGHVWNDLTIEATSLDALLAGLERLGALLAEHAPAAAHNPDEIPNRPRIRT